MIQGNPPLYQQNSLWEALSVISQKWSFPTALGIDKPDIDLVIHWEPPFNFETRLGADELVS